MRRIRPVAKISSGVNAEGSGTEAKALARSFSPTLPRKTSRFSHVFSHAFYRLVEMTARSVDRFPL
jgi:hypothetical protein